MNTNDINLGEIVFQHKNKVVNSAILILAILFANSIYQQQITAADALKQRREIEEKKNFVLGDIQQLEKRIRQYQNFVNRKDVSVVMNIMSELAQDFSINVISIRPETQQENPLYTRYFFVLKLEARDFHDIGKFIGRLESSSELYSVENLIIAPQYSYNQERKLLSVELSVSTILLKD